MSFDYQSENAGTNDQFIVVTTNSAPVPLPAPGANGVLPPAPTTWYLSVYDFDGATNASYTILATYVTNGGVTVIALNSQTNYTYQTNAPPGYPTNLMYSFIADANIAGVQFTVTNLSANGNVELLVGEDVYPTPDDFYIGSFNAGTSQQYVSIATNKDLPSVTNVTWYLAVPNTSGGNVSYSITATESTNGVVPSPLFLGASIASPSKRFHHVLAGRAWDNLSN